MKNVKFIIMAISLSFSALSFANSGADTQLLVQTPNGSVVDILNYANLNGDGINNVLYIVNEKNNFPCFKGHPVNSNLIGRLNAVFKFATGHVDLDPSVVKELGNISKLSYATTATVDQDFDHTINYKIEYKQSSILYKTVKKAIQECRMVHY